VKKNSLLRVMEQTCARLCMCLLHRLIVKKNIKYFYCDDNNVYTMIKYYDLYHNNCNVNYPTFYNKFKKKQGRVMEEVTFSSMYT